MSAGRDLFRLGFEPVPPRKASIQPKRKTDDTPPSNTDAVLRPTESPVDPDRTLPGGGSPVSLHLRDLSVRLDVPHCFGKRARVRYSVATDKGGNRHAYWYFQDRRLEVLLAEDTVRRAIERACLYDDAKRREAA